MMISVAVCFTDETVDVVVLTSMGEEVAIDCKEMINK